MKKIAIIMLVLMMMPAALAMHKTDATTEGKWTVIVGTYTPNHGEMPEGARVDITCRQGDELTDISQGVTRITTTGLYGTSVPKNKCSVGDEVKACVFNSFTNTTDCSEWQEVGLVEYEDDLFQVDYIKRNFPKSHINFASTAIFGVPEYSTVTAGLLIISAIGTIALLRRKKQ